MTCHASSHGILKLSPIFTGFAAANDLDGKSDDEVRAVFELKSAIGTGTQAGDRTTAPLELSYATSSDGNSDGKIMSPVLISFIDLESVGNTTRTQNKRCISGSAKHDGLAAHSDIRTFRGQSAHYCIERNLSRSWKADGIISSSWQPPPFPTAVTRRW